jgi:hypothetical protein
MSDKPITVTSLKLGPTKVICEPFFSAKTGDFVAVRPCDEKYRDKTYLGIMIGNIALGFSARPEDDGTLVVDFSHHNPAIYIPDVKAVVFGCGSWWGKIKSPEHLREITDSDISNVWYVKAIEQLSERHSKEVPT